MAVRSSARSSTPCSWLLLAWLYLGRLVSYCVSVAIRNGPVRRLIFRVVRCGPLPRHVAFIMDGNRRYAAAAGLANRLEGHQHGFGKLQEILQWSLELGIRCVTVYAFSIENFRRPLEEVDCLMALAKEKFHQLCDNVGLVAQHSVAIRVLGQLELLPDDVRQAAERAMRQTQQASHAGLTLNICFPYTSTAELLAISNRLLCRAGEEAITAAAIDQLIYTHPGPSLDLLVRTSGEWRLSEFLIWQATAGPDDLGDAAVVDGDGPPDTRPRPPQLAFVNTLWPSFGLYQFVYLLLQYQLAVWGKHGSRKITL